MLRLKSRVVVVRHNEGKYMPSGIIEDSSPRITFLFLAHRKGWEELKSDCEVRGFDVDENHLCSCSLDASKTSLKSMIFTFFAIR